LLGCLDWIPNQGTCIDVCLLDDVARSFHLHNLKSFAYCALGLGLGLVEIRFWSNVLSNNCSRSARQMLKPLHQHARFSIDCFCITDIIASTSLPADESLLQQQRFAK